MKFRKSGPSHLLRTDNKDKIERKRATLQTNTVIKILRTSILTIIGTFPNDLLTKWSIQPHLFSIQKTPKSSISKIPKVKRFKKQRRGERNLSKTFSRSDESSAWKILKEQWWLRCEKNQSNLMISFTLFEEQKNNDDAEVQN